MRAEEKDTYRCSPARGLTRLGCRCTRLLRGLHLLKNRSGGCVILKRYCLCGFVGGYLGDERRLALTRSSSPVEPQLDDRELVRIGCFRSRRFPNLRIPGAQWFVRSDDNALSAIWRRRLIRISNRITCTL